MKNNYKSILSAFLFITILLISGSIFAQRIVKVPQGVGTLNNTINGDTLANGQRVDPNTIYELARGGYYITIGTISNSGYHLKIRAEEGGGKRPIIRPGVVGGGVSTIPFQAKGDLTLDGVYVTNLDEQGALLLQIIRLSTDFINLTILNSHLDRSGQSAIRCDNKITSITIKNSIVSNIGTMQSPDNGRVVDGRGQPIDNLVMENNTFYNITHRVYRPDNGVVKYLWFNHNTTINMAHWGISLGPVVEAHVRNNIFVNCGFLGRALTPASTQFYVMIEAQPITQAYIDLGYTQILKIHNNNFYMNPTLLSSLPSDRTPTPVFNDHAQAAVNAGGYGNTNTNLSVAFSAAPQVPVNVLTDYFNAAVTPKTDMDKGGGSPDYGKTQMPFIFTYPTSSPLYTAGTANQPLGDLNYFGIPVGVTNDQIIANDFQLYSNYPNPFNPSTNIKYTLPVASNVKVEIFNMLGQLVNTLVNQHQQAGTYNTVWNGNDLNGNQVSTGVYIYKLSTDNFVSAKKMILVK